MAVQDSGLAGRSRGRNESGQRLLPAGTGAFLRRRALELLGILLICAALLLAAACLTYSAADPSLNNAAPGEAANLLGLAGASAADLGLQSLGFAVFPLILLLLSWGWRLLRDGGLRRAGLRLALLPIALLSIAAALAALPDPQTWPLASGLGGFAGDLLLGKLAAVTALPAAVLALAAAPVALLLFFWLLGLTGGEWRAAGRGGARLLGGARRGVEGGAKHGVSGVGLGWRTLGRLFTRNRGEEAEDPLRAAMRRAERREPMLSPTHPGSSAEAEAMLRQGEVLDLAQQRPQTQEAPIPAAPRKPVKAAKPAPRKDSSQGRLDLRSRNGAYELPPLSLLHQSKTPGKDSTLSKDALEKNARLLEGVLADFGVKGEIVRVRPGPVVTRYELEPAPGTKTSRVVNLADDIARSMAALSVRVAVVPGSSVIGIELPNAERETVYLRELLSSEAYETDGGGLPLTLGKDIGGHPLIVNLVKMPHLLIAGTTGSGKSVAVNAMILSLLYRLSPDECKFIMVDPKMLELSVYDGIPHLLSPVVTEPKKAVVALKWTVREMEQRYRSMSQLGVRNIDGYNARIEEARRKGEVLTRKVQTGFDPDTGQPVTEEQPFDLTPLPFIVVVVDEMADLMLVAGKDVEGAIQRLAQMARAAGIHIIMATQRPSVDVITGTIKANFPTRISFHVTSKIDSRTILGEAGAEQLLGQGDMLHMAHGGRITRVHGPLVTDGEVEAAVAFLKAQGEPTYVEEVTKEEEEAAFDMSGGESGGDELFEQAVAIVCQHKKASTSFIQRQLQIGYNRAARIVEQMEAKGIVSEANHVGKREVLIGGAD